MEGGVLKEILNSQRQVVAVALSTLALGVAYLHNAISPIPDRTVN
jgi:hypothetical protein